MTQYLKPSFTIPQGASQAARDNWERIYGKPKPKKRVRKTQRKPRILRKRDV